MIILYICLFFLGASIASFLNASLYRIEKKYKYPRIIEERSHCEKCNKELTWYELIPVFGYIFTNGKCSKCKTTINIYYPISEFFLGIAFVLFFIFEIQFYLWIVLLFLFILSYYDIKHRAISKNLVHIFLSVCAIFFFFFNLNIQSIIIVLLITIFLVVLVTIKKKSFGTGDILVLIGIGLVLNYKEYFTTFWIGILIALLFSLLYAFIKKENIKKMKIPMLPFFMISFLISVIFGESVFEYLLNM